jgi:alanine racemase
MSKTQETILEINLNDLTHNFDYLKSKLTEGTKFMAVVKAFAYGNDAQAIANHLQDLNADYFAVAYTQEGVVLRDAGITQPILVLHPQPVNFKLLIERCLEPNLYSPKVFKQFIALAEQEKQTDYPIHIKFNTGLNRLGFWENDVDFIISKLKTTNAVKVASMFSHLAASEDPNEVDFTKTQIKTFKAISTEFSSKLDYPFLRHLCNTSGILNYPEAHFDMVRSGIGLYGFGNSEKENSHLKPIASLKSIISQIHQIEDGETVGYNRAYQSNGFRKIATIPLGHADGIGRIYGNGQGFVAIQDQKAPIIGNVCMDMIMVDVTHIDCKESDEVIIFDKTFTAEKLANTANTISYELITSISQRIKRQIIK